MRRGFQSYAIAALWWAATVGAASQILPAAASTDASVSPLWEAPGDLQHRDLFNGTWGSAYAPDPAATYTFVRRKQGGVNPGVVVRDPVGCIWNVKQAHSGGMGDEGPAEVALSRVLSAVGYHQPPVYYLPSFTMRGPGDAIRLEPGGRFRLHQPSLVDRGSWSWRQNPFVGTRPFNGLLVILLIFNSWDLKDSNNTLYDVQVGNRVRQWYVVRDLGGSLGESGGMHPKRNNIDKFEREIFIRGVSNDFVKFAYDGKQPELIHNRITVDDVRWATDLLGRLNNRQWHDAFRAGGYPPELSDRFIRKIYANILQGEHLAGHTP
jgi:hypothetical protein